jgi:hypothetical protein
MRIPSLTYWVIFLPGCLNLGHIVLAEGVDGTSGAGGTQSQGGTANAGGATSVCSSSIAPGGGKMSILTKETWDQISNASCLGWSVEAEQEPANIVFIVDTSRSMVYSVPNSDDTRTKWVITKGALEDALNALPRMTSVGMLLWPNMMTVPNNNTSCTYCNPDGTSNPNGIGECVNVSAMVPLAQLGAVDSDQRSALTTALEAVSPQGGTPMADAYNYAIDSNYGNQTQLMNVKYAVLITDGQPTIQLGCMGTGDENHPVAYQPVLDSIKGAYSQAHVKTFVIGSPGSESQSLTNVDGRDWLSEAAQEGGTQLTPDCQNSGPNYCHFDMSATTDFATGFTAALQNITGQILPCTYTISGQVPDGQFVDPKRTNVVYETNGSQVLGDMMLVGQASDPCCPEGDGWYFDPKDPTNMTVQLCPKTCDTIRQDAGAVVNVRGGCGYIG